MIKLSVKIHFQMLPELKSFSPSLGFTSCCWGRTWSRSVRPRSSRGPGPGSTRRSPGRRTHTCGGPAGRRRAHWTRTAVAVEAQKMEPVMLNRCVLSLNITEHRTETPTLLVDSSILRMGVGLCRRQRTDVSEAPLFDMSNRWLSVMPLPLSWGHRGSADVGGLSSGLKVIRGGVQVVQPVYSTHTGCTDVVILQPVGHIWSFHVPIGSVWDQLKQKSKSICTMHTIQLLLFWKGAVVLLTRELMMLVFHPESFWWFTKAVNDLWPLRVGRGGGATGSSLTTSRRRYHIPEFSVLVGCFFSLTTWGEKEWWRTTFITNGLKVTFY